MQTDTQPLTRDILPDFHFLLIAPNLGGEYLFDAARDYWERYQPTVVSNFDLIRLIPEQFTVAVTVLARRDLASQIGAGLAEFRPEALFDPLVYDFFEDVRSALDQRAALNQPFGVPLTPTQTPTAAATSAPVNPTPGAIATRPPGGFITQTPTSDPLQPALPTASPTATETLVAPLPVLPSPTIGISAPTLPPQTPMQPTPGPIVGS
ncbi:MAG: hypothetical protein H7175_05055 [Burkholderiales bacterium]|nr:hypothetical protein [Anaerolineae bacterium]